MGVIKRQSIKQSIVNYLAVGVAAFSTVFIYPLDKEAYGLAGFVLSTAQFAMPFIILGFNGVSVRFFPQYLADRQKEHGFLFFILSGVTFGAVLFVLLWLLFGDYINSIYANRPKIYRQFFPHIVVVAILLSYFNVFGTFVSNFKRIVVPAILQNLIKLVLPVLILLYVKGRIGLEGIVEGIIATYLVVLLLVVAYVHKLGELKWKPDFSWFTKDRRREIRTYSLFFIAGGIGTVLAFQIDQMMVTTMLGFKSNGAYVIAAFIGNAIAIPTVAITKITGPIVSSSFQKKDFTHIEYLYKQSSVNLLLAGLFLFICTIVSVEDLFSLMPKNKEMTGGLAIVALVGGGRVIDMMTSINNQIINYSKYYRFNLVAIFILAIINIFANYILIPRHGIMGAAMATFAALAVYNLIKLFFIYWKLKMQPFSKKTLYLFLIGAACYFIGIWMPASGIAWLDIVLRSAVIALIYVPAIYFFRISDDVNKLIK